MGGAQQDAEPDRPDRPGPGVGAAITPGEEPRFDLAWFRGRAVWVAEVKSITSTNEERQLRTAIGQVLRYRQKLTASGHDVQAIIITSRPPHDSSWDELCQWEGIVLIWPEIAPERLSAEEPRA